MNAAAGNRPTGAEALVRLLDQAGVRHIFGLCGDTSLPFYDALARLDHGMAHLLCRDERSAAYMADGYARVGGRVGVCEGPSGGGATYILPGVVEANESSIGLLALTTDVGRGQQGRFALTALDQVGLFRPLTKWNAAVERSADLPRFVRRAFLEMTRDRPGAAHLALPFDVQTGDVEPADIWIDADADRFPAHPTGPNSADVEALVAAIRGAERPVIICGGGVITAGAEAELAAFAETIGAAVATSISGKGAIAESHPLAVGVVGSNGGTPETRAIVDRADRVIFIGCRAGSVTTERWRHPSAEAGRIVHIDVDPRVFAANYRTDATLAGDARLCLAALNQALDAADSATADQRAATERAIAEARRAKFAAFERLALSRKQPIRPECIVAALQATVPPETIVIADPGTPCPYLAAYWRLDVAGRWFISNRAHGALGYALPAAIGAHLARPGSRAVAVIGDGSFGFVAGELETLARYRPPVTVVVIANGSFGWIKAGQKHGFGERYFAVDFQPTDHARIAEAYGIAAKRIDDPAALRGALAAALKADGPMLIDVVAQPLEEARAPVSEWIA